jgi:hypothetical protein
MEQLVILIINPWIILIKNLHKNIHKTLWPPNSPDLNPLDYYFWSAVVNKMGSQRYKKREEFIEVITKAIEKVPINEIKKAINSFMPRCRKVEAAKGQYVLK